MFSIILIVKSYSLVAPIDLHVLALEVQALKHTQQALESTLQALKLSHYSLKMDIETEMHNRTNALAALEKRVAALEAARLSNVYYRRDQN